MFTEAQIAMVKSDEKQITNLLGRIKRYAA